MWAPRRRLRGKQFWPLVFMVPPPLAVPRARPMPDAPAAGIRRRPAASVWRQKVCQGSVIDGAPVPCVCNAHTPMTPARLHRGSQCMFCCEDNMKTALEKRNGKGAFVRILKTFHVWRAEHPMPYTTAMDRIARWVPDMKNYFDIAAARMQRDPARLAAARAAGALRAGAGAGARPTYSPVGAGAGARRGRPGTRAPGS